MKVKVCGMSDPQNIRAVEALGVDYIGLIFWPRSPRYVAMASSGSGLMPDRASATEEQSTGTTPRVGVFVDPTVQDILTHAYAFGLSAVQLHGHETPTLLRNLRRTLGSKTALWKAISIGNEDDLEVCKAYADCVDCFVFDTRCATVGGSGRHFDWSLLEHYPCEVPFMLSGGIGPDDALALRTALATTLPQQCIGIDLNSRFETVPGLKNTEALSLFLRQLRNP